MGLLSLFEIMLLLLTSNHWKWKQHLCFRSHSEKICLVHGILRFEIAVSCSCRLFVIEDWACGTCGKGKKSMTHWEGQTLSPYL